MRDDPNVIAFETLAAIAGRSGEVCGAPDYLPLDERYEIAERLLREWRRAVIESRRPPNVRSPLPDLAAVLERQDAENRTLTARMRRCRLAAWRLARRRVTVRRWWADTRDGLFARSDAGARRAAVEAARTEAEARIEAVIAERAAADEALAAYSGLDWVRAHLKAGRLDDAHVAASALLPACPDDVELLRLFALSLGGGGTSPPCSR